MGGYKTLILLQFQNFPGMCSQIVALLPGAQAPVIKALLLPKLPFSFFFNPLFYLLHVSGMTLNNPRSLYVLFKSVQRLFTEHLLRARLLLGYTNR